MPLLILTYLIQIGCAIDALRRGAPFPLIFLIASFPLIGCAIYIFAVLLPDIRRSRAVMQAGEVVKDTLAPDRRLRQYSDDLNVSDTVENRLKLGDELHRNGQYDQAAALYEDCLSGPFEDSPEILIRLMTTYFAAENWESAVKTFERLPEGPSTQSLQDAQLLYARALEAMMLISEADKAYQDSCAVYRGPEAKCRYAAFLDKAGRRQEAEQVYGEVLQGAKHAPKHIVKRHRAWIDEARRALDQRPLS